MSPTLPTQKRRRRKMSKKEMQMEMEEREEVTTSSSSLINGSAGIADHWWWTAASASQLAWGISAYRRGHSGGSQLMPFKAFAVASLFVGALASAASASLLASGIHTVEDMKMVGASIRTGLGIPPRTRDD